MNEWFFYGIIVGMAAAALIYEHAFRVVRREVLTEADYAARKFGRPTLPNGGSGTTRGPFR